MKKLNNILLILFFFVNAALGQSSAYQNKLSDYEIKLKEADNFFSEGHFDKCITDLEWILKSCQLSKNEKENVLQLLAKAEIEIGQPEQADSAIHALLKNNPHYQLNEDIEPEQFCRMFKKYTVHPLLTIGARNTIDFIHIHTTKSYSLNNGLNYNQSNTNQDLELMYYGTMEYEFYKNIALCGDLIFFWSFYDRYISNIYFSERDYYIETPVYIKKYFPIKKNILPYIASGIGLMRLYKATAFASTDTIASYFNVLNMRNHNLFEIIEGAGIGYQYRNLRLFLDVRLYQGLTSITNASQRYDNSTLINDYHYIDNSIKLNQFEIGATITYTLINSIKKKIIKY